MAVLTSLLVPLDVSDTTDGTRSTSLPGRKKTCATHAERTRFEEASGDVSKPIYRPSYGRTYKAITRLPKPCLNILELLLKLHHKHRLHYILDLDDNRAMCSCGRELIIDQERLALERLKKFHPELQKRRRKKHARSS